MHVHTLPALSGFSFPLNTTDRAFAGMHCDWFGDIVKEGAVVLSAEYKLHMDGQYASRWICYQFPSDEVLRRSF